MPPRFKARTSLLTGKVTVRISPGADILYYDALWVHEQIHRIQRDRMIREKGWLKGAWAFATCRANRQCTWTLEREAYKAEILYLRAIQGKSRVFREQWISLLTKDGYPLLEVRELCDEIEQMDSGTCPVVLDSFIRFCLPVRS